MSKILPQQTVDALRQQVDLSLDSYGIDVELYIPTNLTDIEPLDAFTANSDITYTKYTCQAFIDWKPSNIYRLRKLGLFIEGNDIPILCWMPRYVLNSQNQPVQVSIEIRSYIRVAPQFIPNNFAGVEEYDIVDVVTRGLHDSMISTAYRLAPRRVNI